MPHTARSGEYKRYHSPKEGVKKTGGGSPMHGLCSASPRLAVKIHLSAAVPACPRAEPSPQPPAPVTKNPPNVMAVGSPGVSDTLGVNAPDCKDK